MCLCETNTVYCKISLVSSFLFTNKIVYWGEREREREKGEEFDLLCLRMKTQLQFICIKNILMGTLSSEYLAYCYAYLRTLICTRQPDKTTQY